MQKEGGLGSDIPKPVPTSVAASPNSVYRTHSAGVLEAKRRREFWVLQETQSGAQVMHGTHA